MDGTIGNGDILIASGGGLNIAGATNKQLGGGGVRLSDAGTIHWLGPGGAAGNEA